MKKILSILLLFLLILNTFGIIGYYYYNRSVIKSEIKAIMKSNIPKDKIEIVLVHKNSKAYKRIHSKEFRFHGKMYDIIKEKVKGDSLYFVCINDVKEQELMQDFSRIYFGSENGIVSTGYSGKILNTVFLPMFESKKPIKHINTYCFIKYTSYPEKCINSYYEVEVPPPKC